jgi:hypothetical protein
MLSIWLKIVGILDKVYREYKNAAATAAKKR